MFVGDGELRLELERFVSDQGFQRVRFLGFHNQTEISKAYVAADLLVLPSDYETWGLVVNEAMCSSLPIVAGDRVGSAVDLVRNGYNGYTFPSGDVPALAQRLAPLLSDAELRQRMGENSRKVISSWGLDETASGIVRAALSVGGQQRKDC